MITERTYFCHFIIFHKTLLLFSTLPFFSAFVFFFIFLLHLFQWTQNYCISFFSHGIFVCYCNKKTQLHSEGMHKGAMGIGHRSMDMDGITQTRCIIIIQLDTVSVNIYIYIYERGQEMDSAKHHSIRTIFHKKILAIGQRRRVQFPWCIFE